MTTDLLHQFADLLRVTLAELPRPDGAPLGLEESVEIRPYYSETLVLLWELPPPQPTVAAELRNPRELRDRAAWIAAAQDLRRQCAASLARLRAHERAERTAFLQRVRDREL